MKELVNELKEVSRKLDLNITLQKELLSLLKKSVYEVEEFVNDPLFKGIDNKDAKTVLSFIIEYVNANGKSLIPLRAIAEGTGLSLRRVGLAIQYLNEKGLNLPLVTGDELEDVRKARKKK